ncbi:MAG: 3'-5' exonuclease domain-containing protein 2 [Desulfovibrio sp.]|nr:3'-5' exonuclease domain-containing protein 2 [Desulfovibrio sp.]MCA1985234.1 3'-5' exonuclease domain-containing protein 2 [Desulfovibrio sp.]
MPILLAAPRPSTLESYRQPIPPEAINALPLTRYEGPVHVFPDAGDLDAAISDLIAEPVIGFDTERRPTFRKGQNFPLSLLQLATANAVYLFQLCRMNVPTILESLMSDPGTVKTGVAVHDDVRELREVLRFDAAGFVDLGQVARVHNLPTCGLRNLAANFLGIRISKKERCSNWGRESLTPQQIAYAATDAWASREIHLRMQAAKLL